MHRIFKEDAKNMYGACKGYTKDMNRMSAGFAWICIVYAKDTHSICTGYDSICIGYP